MRVLVCIPCLLTGGTEIQTLNLVRALVEGGYEVTTVCYFEFSLDMVTRYEHAGSKVIRLSTDGIRPVGVMSTLIFLFKGLRQVIKGCQPDIAHVQYMAPGAIPIIFLRMLGVKKIIATTHTFADIYPNLQLIHFIVNHVLVAFQCITLRAEESYFGGSKFYSETYPLRKKGNHFTIYNALPCGVKTCNNRRNHQPKVIGVVSRLEPIKGMDLVIPAFAEVKNTHPHVKLIIVGNGSLKKLMQQQAKEFGVLDSIEWAGRQPQEKLHEWYGKMDIVLMPSRSEGFGLTAIEAMANGCVVVASNTGGLPEVVKNGEVGLLHTSESIASLAEKIVFLMNDESIIKGMQHNLRKHLTQYSFTYFAQMMNNLYSRIWDL